jgi:type IV secretory pathway VirB4 component
MYNQSNIDRLRRKSGEPLPSTFNHRPIYFSAFKHSSTKISNPQHLQRFSVAQLISSTKSKSQHPLAIQWGVA